ncbi:hypothetical protein CDD83_10176 [Cordyceps sp. RAO-2017]|nr:hypothetical protein CDD83_10176 [Cordyceps sp. RAO-2017]
MASKKIVSLWNPSLGIRFSSSLKSACPQLDVGRSVHTTAGSGYGHHDRGDESTVSTESGLTIEAAALNEAPFIRNGSYREPHDDSQVVETSDEKAHVPEDKAKDQQLVAPIFTMSSQLFDAAKAAPAGTAESFWSHTLYESTGDGGVKDKVKVYYCTNAQTMESLCKTHFLGQKILGFDLEWSPFVVLGSTSPRTNLSLIQLASPSSIALFHVAVFAGDYADEGFIAPTFRDIMGDPDVSKVGVNILGDCTRLRKHLGVETRGVFELSHLHNLIDKVSTGGYGRVGKSVVSLATQVEEHLGLPLYKGEVVRRSNWLQRLTQKQIGYSAADAYAGIQLYYALEAKRKRLFPRPPRPDHAELGLPIRTALTNDEDGTQKRSRAAKAPAAVEVPSGSEHTAPAPAELASAEPWVPPPPAHLPAADTRDARVVEADLMARQYRRAKSTPVAGGWSRLVAYYLWHTNRDLDPEAIAKLMRSPPLQKHSVITYILAALVTEELPYDKARLRNEVMSFLHPTALTGKIRSLAKDCEFIKS